MDNLTHSLFGVCLAKAGLERTTPLATATLLVSSSLPDIDTVMRIAGPISHLEHHRGLTHSFAGMVVLAAAFTLLLVVVDARLRTRRDPFRRPIRPLRIFWLAYLGGLGHIFMDYTNSYGVRPLLPFSNRWFYGDLTFVADPWIWLILGSAAVWLTATSPARGFFWGLIGVSLAILVALAFREPLETLAIQSPPVSDIVRVIWFLGLAVVTLGAIFRWGRAGQKLARYALVALGLYYCGMAAGAQSAMEQARSSLPASDIASVAVWPAPANPLLWQSVASSSRLYGRHIDLANPVGSWQELPVLDARFIEALKQAEEGRAFLRFARFVSGTVDEQADGYEIDLRDLRFPLRMKVRLGNDLAVQRAQLRWF